MMALYDGLTLVGPTRVNLERWVNMTSSPLPEISDDMMRQLMPTAKSYCVVILKAGPNKDAPDAASLIWEHGRRNFALRAQGVLAIVCPVRDGSDVSGVGIFAGSVDEVRSIMDEDPGVQAGVFVYEAHACRSFPGDSLPA